MNEFEIINRYFNHRIKNPNIVLGVGDDCSLLDLPTNTELALSVDTLIAGVHFPETAAPELIGERALCVAISDLAAMGATPIGFTLALSLPEAQPDWLQGFTDGLSRAAGYCDCDLVGGDTTKGHLTISIQVMGYVERGQAIRRSGARAGDTIFVTGYLGDGGAALAVIEQRWQVEASLASYFEDRFYRPHPKIHEGQKLLGVASAAIDISDGLLADLNHICVASQVDATLEIEQLPLSSFLRQHPDPQQIEQWALAGGDDYQLCFTVAEEKLAVLQALIDQTLIQATAIGKIVAGNGQVVCTKGGQPIAPQGLGYRHFD